MLYDLHAVTIDSQHPIEFIQPWTTISLGALTPSSSYVKSRIPSRGLDKEGILFYPTLSFASIEIISDLK